MERGGASPTQKEGAVIKPPVKCHCLNFPHTPGLSLVRLPSYITPPSSATLILPPSPRSLSLSLSIRPKISTSERKLLEKERARSIRRREAETPQMATRRSPLPLFFLLLSASIALLTATSEAISSATGGAAELGWIPARTACRGTIAECLAGDEFELDSEISRRILASSRYISYDSLKRDSVPCSRRGASYYNCRPGAQANPYSRGCSAITRCRR